MNLAPLVPCTWGGAALHPTFLLPSYSTTSRRTSVTPPTVSRTT